MGDELIREDWERIHLHEQILLREKEYEEQLHFKEEKIVKQKPAKIGVKRVKIRQFKRKRNVQQKNSNR